MKLSFYYSNKFPAFTVAIASLLIASHPAQAADKTWNNTGTDFNTAGSWTGGAPGTGDKTVFSTTATSQPDLSSSLTIQGLNFSAAGASGYNLTSTSTSIKLTLTNIGTGTTGMLTSTNTSGTNTIAAPIVMGAASGTQTIAQSGSGGNLTVSGAISSTAATTLSLTMTGTSTLTLSGTNTYTGSTALAGASIVASTILAIGNNSAFSGGSVSLNSGITLTAVGGARNIANSVTWAASGTIGGVNDLEFSGNFTGSGSNTRTLTSNNSGTTTLSGNVYLAPDNTNPRGLIIAGSGAVVISGIIANNNSGNTLASNFTLNSTGSLKLSNANTYTGTTTLSAGTLTLGNKAAFGSSSNVAWNGVTTSASTDLSGANAIANTGSLGAAGNIFNGSNNIELSGNLTNNITAQTVTNNIAVGSLKLSGSIYLSNAAGTGRTLTLNGSGATAISGVIANFNGSGTASNIAYGGTGTLTLSGGNTYTGTTAVNTGTLLINGNQSTATGNVTVSSGAVLGGSGTVGGATTIGGTHAVGNAGIDAGVGKQTFSSTLTYGSGSIFEWDLNGNTTSNRGVAGGFDAVDGSGALSVDGTAVTGSIFKIVLGTGVILTDPFWSTPNTTQTWNNIFSGFSGLTGGFDTSNLQVVGQSVSGIGSFSVTGTSLTWSAVPEPSSALAGLLLGAGLLRRRRVA